MRRPERRVSPLSVLVSVSRCDDPCRGGGRREKRKWLLLVSCRKTELVSHIMSYEPVLTGLWTSGPRRFTNLPPGGHSLKPSITSSRPGPHLVPKRDQTSCSQRCSSGSISRFLVFAVKQRWTSFHRTEVKMFRIRGLPSCAGDLIWSQSLG